MPAPLQVDREAARVLCVAVGVREAARQMGIPEATMQAWSARGKWTQKITDAQATKAERLQSSVITLQPIATKPAEALYNSLEETGKQTKLNLVKAASKAAKSFSERTGEAVIKSAKALREITSTAATLHGWEQAGSTNVQINLAVGIGGVE